MRTFTNSLRSWVAMLGILTLGAWPAAAQYEVVDLGTLFPNFEDEATGYYLGIYAHDINNRGQVVGQAEVPDDLVESTGFLYDGTTLIDLGLVGPGGATAINDAGQVVGNAASRGFGVRAFLIDTTTMTDTDLLDSAMMTDIDMGGFDWRGQSLAYGINDAGQVVGAAQTIEGELHAFLYDGTAMTDLGVLGRYESQANGINNSGQVVGYSEVNNGIFVEHAFLYSDGTMTDLGTLGGTSSRANRINDSGLIIGYSDIAGDSAEHAFLSDGTTMTDLGTLGGTESHAYDINASGQVVGSSDLTGNSDQHGFLYSNGIMTDLNSLLDPDSGWRITNAHGINDRGQIAAWGARNGHLHAVLLNPAAVPEPATLLMSGLAILIGGGYGWRRRRAGGRLH